MRARHPSFADLSAAAERAPLRYHPHKVDAERLAVLLLVEDEGAAEDADGAWLAGPLRRHVCDEQVARKDLTISLLKYLCEEALIVLELAQAAEDIGERVESFGLRARVAHYMMVKQEGSIHTLLLLCGAPAQC